MRRIKSVIVFFAILLVISIVACAKDAEIGETHIDVQAKQENENKVVLKLPKLSYQGKDGSEIFAVQGTNGADKGFEKLIELMSKKGLYLYKTSSTPEGLISRSDVVLLKFNCQWWERGGTNTDLIKSVAEAIIKHPEGFEGEIIIADNGQGQYGPLGKGGSIEWSRNNAANRSQSVKKVADTLSKDNKVSAMTWDGITTKEVRDYSKEDYEDGFIISSETASTGIRISYPKFRTKYGTYVSFKDGIWDKDRKAYDKERLKVINMPVLKSHTMYQVTGSIKNYMGTTSDKLNYHWAHNSIAEGGMGNQMAGTRMPALNIMDAIWINPYPGRGPSTDYKSAAETDIIAASIDPGALDYWSAKYILMETAKKLGLTNYETMSPENPEPGNFGYWLQKSVQELQKSGIKSNLDEKRIRVYVDAMNNHQ